MTECPRCQTRGKTWEGSDPRCAFPAGVFTPDNWNCATMNALRDLSDALDRSWRDDNAAASMGYVPIGDALDGASGYVVMSWYKSRGRTGQAWTMWDDDTPHLTTLAEAEAAIQEGERLVADYTQEEFRDAD